MSIFIILFVLFAFADIPSLPTFTVKFDEFATFVPVLIILYLPSPSFLT